MAQHFLQGPATSEKNLWALLSTQGPEGQINMDVFFHNTISQSCSEFTGS
jgi:hypothetical protein